MNDYPVCTNAGYTINHPSFDAGDSIVTGKQSKSLHGDCKTFTPEEIKAFCEANNLKSCK